MYYTSSDMHTYAIGKAGVTGVSQGRLRLKALIDCCFGVYVAWPHLTLCQCVLQDFQMETVRCAMLVIHQEIDSFNGI